VDRKLENSHLALPAGRRRFDEEVAVQGTADRVRVLRQAEEGTSVAEVCRNAGISEASFYDWRKKYDGLLPSEMKRLKQLEEENQRLKKRVTDLSTRQGDAAGRDPPKNIKPARKRQMVDEVRAVWQVSIRRTCQALLVDRSS
jgi:putative transposase